MATLVSCGRRSGPQPTPEALYAEAESAYHHGDLSLAQSKSEAGYEKFLSSNPELAGKFRVLQLNMMTGRGLYSRAIEEIEKSPPEVFATCELAARKHMAEAFAYLKLGRASQSTKSMNEAERQCATPGPDLAADLATRRGVLQSDLPLAEAEYRIALTIAREQQDSYRETGALVNLSNASQRQEHYDESLDWAAAALEIAQKKGYRLYEEMAVGNTAWSFYKLGDRERALTLCNEAVQLARNLGAGAEQIHWQNNIGLIHEQTGQLQNAEADYRQALALAQQLQDSNQTNIALLELAFVSIQTGDWVQAEKLSQEGMELAHREQNPTLELQAMLAQGLIAAHNGDQEAAERLFSDVARDPRNDSRSFRWEAQAALANLYAGERRAGAANAEYQAAIETVRNARCSVNREELRIPFFANATRVFSSYIDFLVQQGKTAEALKTADESRALTLAEGLRVDKQKCLASETVFNPQRTARAAAATILFYWLGAEHSYLWAVAPDRLKLYALPPAAEILPAVQAYRKALVGSRDVLEAGDANGAALYQTLVAPAEELFGRDQRVIIITDGSLSGLNFETLIDRKPTPHYWIEDVTVENASSLRLLASGAERHARNGGRLLLMGNSVPPSGGGFEALPNAAKEMQSVREHFATVDEQIYEQGSSTPSAYINGHPEQFAYIHFVAHGTASLSDPLDSAVVLSPTALSGNDNDYKLYARDVMTRPLKAELVTVSACKGAGVRAYAGEGLVGLSWAFLHAGAHHVIGALWDVSDEATPQLMAKMYSELTKGHPPDAALRTAKLSLLHSGPPFRKPYYWAAFQLYTGS